MDHGGRSGLGVDQKAQQELGTDSIDSISRTQMHEAAWHCYGQTSNTRFFFFLMTKDFIVPHIRPSSVIPGG